MKHINGTNSIALGSMGIIVMSALTGCQERPQEQVNSGNKFMVIEQQANGKYIVVEEHPTDGANRAIIRNADGTERFMNEEELKTLAQQEYQKVQNGTSETVQQNSGDSGMGLGSIILGAAAGALMGNMIANSLMNNKNFSKNAQSSNRSAYSRSANSGSRSSSSPSRTSSSNKKSFFGRSGSSSRNYGG